MRPNPDKPGMRGPFTEGMNNRSPDHALSIGELRNAVNVEIDSRGFLRRRRGYDLVLSLDNAHSLFSDGFTTLCVAGTILYRLRATPAGDITPEPIHYGLTANLRMAYVSTPRGILYSNGAISGHLSPSGVQSWGIAPPAAELTLKASAGRMPSGTYQVGYTYMRADGEESGAPMITSITLNGGESVADALAGIDVMGIAASLDPSVIGVALYCSAPNGTELRFVALLPAGQTYAGITKVPTGRVMPEQPLVQMPAGDVLAMHGARIYSALGSRLTFSEEWDYGRTHPVRNVIPFPGDITNIVPVSDGMYVVADKTYFFAGFNPRTFESRIVLPYGGVKHTTVELEHTTDKCWFSQRGLIHASAGGNVKNMQEDKVVVEPATIGAAIAREGNGVRQVISNLIDPNTSRAVATSYMEAEIIRKETTL